MQFLHEMVPFVHKSNRICETPTGKQRAACPRATGKWQLFFLVWTERTGKMPLVLTSGFSKFPAILLFVFICFYP
jgi:hypothetical protein